MTSNRRIVQGAPSPGNGDAETSGTSGRPAPTRRPIPQDEGCDTNPITDWGFGG